MPFDLWSANALNFLPNLTRLSHLFAGPLVVPESGTSPLRVPDAVSSGGPPSPRPLTLPSHRRPARTALSVDPINPAAAIQALRALKVNNLKSNYLMAPEVPGAQGGLRLDAQVQRVEVEQASSSRDGRRALSVLPAGDEWAMSGRWRLFSAENMNDCIIYFIVQKK
ncbi:hypothetical protein OH77DRAFT_1549148 [Trametes cingulata]|nr:hypothetical protein OH77DRAFT_1549148 [Trametes cingulata]